MKKGLLLVVVMLATIAVYRCKSTGHLRRRIIERMA